MSEYFGERWTVELPRLRKLDHDILIEMLETLVNRPTCIIGMTIC
jgi:hypothetical protein